MNGGEADPTVESIITAPIVDPSDATNDLIHIGASNVTVDGFVVDGDNTAIANQSGATVVNGVNTDSRRAIETEDAAGSLASANNVVVEYNVIQNFAQRGVELVNPSDTSPATSGDSVTQNVVRNFGQYGVLLAFNAYGDVTYNTIVAPDGATAGIMAQDFTTSGATTAAKTVDISHNNVTVGEDAYAGIWSNLLHPSAVTALNIAGNTVNGSADVGDDLPVVGIYVTSLDGGMGANVTSNSVGTTGGQLGVGIGVWNSPTASGVSVSGGTIANSAIGIDLDGVDFNFGGANSDTTLNVNAVSITGGTTGIRVGDVPTTLPGAPYDESAGPNVVSGSVVLNLTGSSTISGAATGIYIVGQSSGSYTANAHINAGTSFRITDGPTGNNSSGVGILVSGTKASATVSGVIINDPLYGIEINGGSATVSNSTIENNTTGVYVTGDGSVTLTGNTITANVTGVKIDGGSTLVSATGNDITNNTGYGIDLENGAILTDSISDNDLLGQYIGRACTTPIPASRSTPRLTIGAATRPKPASRVKFISRAARCFPTSTTPPGSVTATRVAPSASRTTAVRSTSAPAADKRNSAAANGSTKRSPISTPAARFTCMAPARSRARELTTRMSMSRNF